MRMQWCGEEPLRPSRILNDESFYDCTGLAVIEPSTASESL
jgi:hypothetical protein